MQLAPSRTAPPRPRSHTHTHTDSHKPGRHDWSRGGESAGIDCGGRRGEEDANQTHDSTRSSATHHAHALESPTTAAALPKSPPSDFTPAIDPRPRLWMGLMETFSLVRWGFSLSLSPVVQRASSASHPTHKPPAHGVLPAARPRPPIRTLSRPTPQPTTPHPPPPIHRSNHRPRSSTPPIDQSPVSAAAPIRSTSRPPVADGALAPLPFRPYAMDRREDEAVSLADKGQSMPPSNKHRDSPIPHART